MNNGYPPAEPPAPRKDVSFEGRTVLVVDDDETVRSVVKSCLERFGLTVLLAEDGIRGLEVFTEHKDDIACVLLDLNMPRMDGEETLRELRKLKVDAQVILSSGYSEQGSERFVGKVAGFLEKPFKLNDLRQCITGVLQSLP